MNPDLARSARSLVKMRSERVRTELSRLMETLRVKGRLGVTNHDVERWIASKQFFFILAIGRSGTTFLAHLLNIADNAAVFHEPAVSDIDAYRRAFFSPRMPSATSHRFGKKEMYLRARTKDVSCLRRGQLTAPPSRAGPEHHFPTAGFLHMVRDGRTSSELMMSTDALRPGDMWTWWLRPHESDPYFAQWPTMDRFAKLCWYWRVENHHLRTHIGNTVRFEEVTRDYDRFEQRILRPFGLVMSPTVWQQQAGVQRNATDHLRVTSLARVGCPADPERSRRSAAMR